MSTKEDLQNENIPKYIYDIENRKLIEWTGQFIYGWGWHHTVKQQILKRNENETLKEASKVTATTHHEQTEARQLY